MKNRELIDILDDLIETIEKAKSNIDTKTMKLIDDLNEEAQYEFEATYRKCDACGEWVNEDLLEERYDENICQDCLENGYGE